METFSISAISNMFYVDEQKTVWNKHRWIVNMPMSIYVHEPVHKPGQDKPDLVARVSFGIKDRTNAALELNLSSFKWFTRDGTNLL